MITDEQFQELTDRVTKLEGVRDPIAQTAGGSTMGQAGPGQTVSAVIPLPANKIQLQRNLYTGLPISPNNWNNSGSVVIDPNYTVFYNWRTDVDANGVATLHPFSELHG